MRLVPRIAGMSSRLTINPQPRSERIPRRSWVLNHPDEGADGAATWLIRLLRVPDCGGQATPAPSPVTTGSYHGRDAGVAQLVRALAFQAGCREFESRLPLHSRPISFADDSRRVIASTRTHQLRR